ncbi:MAG: hypothetical protein ABIP80_06105, partial [Ferruginibacter sp.]
GHIHIFGSTHVTGEGIMTGVFAKRPELLQRLCEQEKETEDEMRKAISSAIEEQWLQPLRGIVAPRGKAKKKANEKDKN